MRGAGACGRLIAAVEGKAAAAAIPMPWLYTNRAGHIYARFGWRNTGTVEYGGRPFVLMRRDLGDRA